jgi:hypothetical protein
MSSSVIRRYTPPTCTLEIIGQSSPLSRWTKQPVIKNLRFRLHFDDPREEMEAKITLKGDRTQLETLSETVTTTVQNLLTQSPPSQLKTLTQHQLNLGPLGENDQDLTVTLSALQLFDLATAIEQYNLDLLTLPEAVETPKPITQPNHPFRFAASLLLGIGITASSVIIFKDLYPHSQASFETATQAPSPEIYDNPSIAQSPTVPPAPLEAIPSPSPSPMTSDEKLPPPPPVGGVTPEAANLPPAPTFPPSAPPPEPNFPPPEPVLSAPSEGIFIPPPPSIAEPEETAILPAPEAVLPPLAPPPSLERPPTELDDVIPPTEAQSASPPLEARGENSLFDNIPQVAEARRYFEQRWTPPESLDKTIEYNIALNSDGTVQGITPLGETAATYLDRTGMPLLGERLVSPLEGNLQPRFRVVLNPDGTVQTFLQSGN